MAHVVSQLAPLWHGRTAWIGLAIVLFYAVGALVTVMAIVPRRRSTRSPFELRRRTAHSPTNGRYAVVVDIQPYLEQAKAKRPPHQHVGSD
ncbi:hypothetical protein TPY_0571 [Sulfobacillus acidophilus TPY]|uniref:Uncharacterized protein n=1 Tax=Sulfobacillus acidophilus (strain ATCC 700253 / DSM 10332 / NAL) TaxID=679936 RepID=G8U0X8_SULAD|nr:hypothetical protein TPY_0571 [Sulfobacillus acidophilus TPY]AEW06523.1 hypothetical protein Sulac_3066 [Sulfobacillus acidophilus DSM 10332]